MGKSGPSGIFVGASDIDTEDEFDDEVTEDDFAEFDMDEDEEVVNPKKV